MLWKVKNSKTKQTEYVRADSVDTAKAAAEKIGLTGDVFQPIDCRIFAVDFSDYPKHYVFFSGTKADAMRAARLYIRQWQLDAHILSITER